MQPAFTNPSAAHQNQMRNWDYLALSLNLLGLSALFIVVSFIIGFLGTGSDLWRWLTDQGNVKET